MVSVDDVVGMKNFRNFLGFIDETHEIPQEDVRGVDRGVVQPH